MRPTNSRPAVSITYSTREVKLAGSAGSGWLDLSWPVLVLVAIFGGVMLSTTNTIENIHAALQRLRQAYSQPVEHPKQVLIVSANPDRQMQVAATLSPRGMRPLISTSLESAKAQIAAHPGVLSLAVIDEAAGQSHDIREALPASLPTSRIVLLPRATPRAAIPQMLLDRL
jgi:hypothetical protein